MEEDVPQPSTVPEVEDMDASHIRNDSLVTVRLSEPVHLKIDTKFETTKELPDDEAEQHDAVLPEAQAILDDGEEEVNITDRLSTSSDLSTVKPEAQSLDAEIDTDNLSSVESRRGSGISKISTIEAEAQNLTEELNTEDLPAIESRRGSKLPILSTVKVEGSGELETKGSISESRRGSNDSENGEVNWAELQKNEAEEPKDEGSEDSTALLLARLEQENNILATNPKSGLAQADSTGTRPRGQSRPPSMQQLKNMVNQPPLPSLRYSLIQAPPMTDLEFYAALVQDYPKTLRKLPTLVSRKIRGGIPPPLRGVVWQSISGSRDPALEDQYERLSGETSPYEGIIGKDLGRSFPGVEMFRDPEGDGQRSLGTVLKCFSLYDQKIGYCQGLGFLVGPLLMHMPDKEAFCILVKLMEHYGLRDCFLPDLSGLHVRIYQFRSLLKQHIPNVSAHLEMLQIEPAYVSQWFLSFFAVTCPLPMLFRIFDVIFAEGASETVMRVALSLMRMNEAKIVACTELEDVMQLLLSRGLWDCYHSNADELVNDFVTFSGVVTYETLQALEVAYKDSRAEVRTSDVGSAAGRFLGRLWTGSTASMKLTPSLSPGLSAPTRPVSFLRRSPSKQSIASTLNSIEGKSDTTDTTTISRDSSNTDNSSIRTDSVTFGNNGRKTIMSTMSKKDDLHGQIEDLLIAMSEVQREKGELETQLQREREEREEDRVTVIALLQGLTRKSRMEALQMVEGDINIEKTPSMVNTEVKDFGALDISKIEDGAKQEPPKDVDLSSYITAEELSSLLDTVEDRFQAEKDNRRSSILQSKHQLRDELARSKEQLANEVSKAQDLARRLAVGEQEITSLREQLRDSHAHIRSAHGEKQRLERQVSEMKQAARNRSPATSPDGSEVESGWSGRGSTFSSASAAGSGLRELKLGRTGSTKSTKATATFTKRTSSLQNPLAHATAETTEREHHASSSVSSVISTAPTSPAPSNIADNEALILELVQAKTAKVIAEQEMEEMKVKLDSLRKMMGGGHKASPSIEKTATQGAFMSYMGRSVSSSSVESKASVPAGTPSIVATPPSKDTTPESKPTTATPTALGGFWSGWGKKT